MNNCETVKRILDIGIVPIIRASDENKIAVAAEALVNAGLGVLEISLSVQNGLSILKTLADRYGDRLLLGAGTVLDRGMVRSSISAGARFIVSPSTDISVIDECRKLSMPIFPGALTPSEIVLAWKAGADAIKVFPVSAVGGPPYISALRPPLPDVVLFPCGGVNESNAAAYFAAGASALLLGSSLVDMTLPAENLFTSIQRTATVFMSIAALARTFHA